MRDTLYIIIPAYNEAQNIETVAREWHHIVCAAGKASRLVIIDDGSTDDTYDILMRLSSELSQLVPLTKQNEGHGATLLFGYRYALSCKADYIFQTDSDGQTLPEEFGPFWKHRHEYDAILGFRNHRQDGLSRIFVTKVLKFVLQIVFHLNVTDANTPYRLMRSSLLARHIDRVPAGFNLSNVMLTVFFMDAGEQLCFVPITFRPRQGGENSINLKKIFKIGRKALSDFRVIKKEMNRHEY